MKIDTLRELCAQAYWYGEDTGDYEMKHVHEQDWFKEAIPQHQPKFQYLANDLYLISAWCHIPYLTELAAQRREGG